MKEFSVEIKPDKERYTERESNAKSILRLNSEPSYLMRPIVTVRIVIKNYRQNLKG